MSRRDALVLVADDDNSSSSAIEKMLAKDGHRCLRARNGQEALRLFWDERPDLIILDVMMPLLDGFQVCERIREHDRATPVLFLTAKGDIVDKRIGYGIGGDDYLVKPFSGEELRLRVGALLRRAQIAAEAAASAPQSELYHVGDLEVNVRTGNVRLAGKRVELTPKESRIMAVLASHPGEVYSKRDLIEERSIWTRLSPFPCTYDAFEPSWSRIRASRATCRRYGTAVTGWQMRKTRSGTALGNNLAYSLRKNCNRARTPIAKAQ